MWIPLLYASVLIYLSAMVTFLIFTRFWKRESKVRNFARDISVSIYSVLLLLLIVELGFGLFVVHSDNYSFTLASKRWLQKYWHPINSDGYRDHEHDWTRQILFVVGDSLAAGYGIKDIDERLAGILANKLGKEWTVAVLARNGWTPASEYSALVNHHKRPQKIIVSYYINDIESAAKKNGLSRPQLVEKPKASLRPFVDNSFMLNWIYWRFHRGGAGGAYWSYLRRAYGDPKIWSSHEQELRSIISFARQAGADIVFIVWPNLNDVEGSAQFTGRVVEFLLGEGVKTIDLATRFRNRDPKTLVVNAMDGHPNEEANAEVAELAYESLDRGDRGTFIVRK